MGLPMDVPDVGTYRLDDQARAAAGPPTRELAEEERRKPFKWPIPQGGKDTSGEEVTARLERLFRQPQQPQKWKMTMPDRPTGIQVMRICLDSMDRLLGIQCPC